MSVRARPKPTRRPRADFPTQFGALRAWIAGERSVAEAAAVAGVTPRTLYRWRAAVAGPPDGPRDGGDPSSAT